METQKQRDFMEVVQMYLEEIKDKDTLWKCADRLVQLNQKFLEKDDHERYISIVQKLFPYVVSLDLKQEEFLNHVEPYFLDKLPEEEYIDFLIKKRARCGYRFLYRNWFKKQECGVMEDLEPELVRVCEKINRPTEERGVCPCCAYEEKEKEVVVEEEDVVPEKVLEVEEKKKKKVRLLGGRKAEGEGKKTCIIS
jgi:hypothetical protein